MSRLPVTFQQDVEGILANLEGHDTRLWNESNTKALIVEPVLAALGWDTRNPNVVMREHRVYDGTLLDYALHVDSRPLLYCEVKSTGSRLDDPKWVAQTINYANNTGVVWCALTDGLRWRLFKANEAVEMDRKLAFEVDLHDVQSPENRESALTLFGLLTPTAVSEGELTKHGMQVLVDARVTQALVEILEAPNTNLVNAVMRLLGADVDLKPEDVLASLSRVGPIAAEPLRGHSPGKVLVTAPSQERPTPRASGGRDERVARAQRTGAIGRSAKARLRAARERAFPNGTQLSFEPSTLASSRANQVRRWIAENASRGTAVVDWAAGRDYLIWDFDGRHYSPTGLTTLIVDLAVGKGDLGSFNGAQCWRDQSGQFLTNVAD